MEEGQIVFDQKTLREKQAITNGNLAVFGGYQKLIYENKPYPVYLTPACFEMQESMIQEL